MCYEDIVMDKLEECLSYEDIEDNYDKIDELIEQERLKKEDAMRPEVLVETVKTYIFEGVWRGKPNYSDCEKDEFEIEQMFC